MHLYPLLFKPIYKETIWGGQNLARVFGRQLPSDKSIGESWEIADLVEGTSVVANGPAAGKGLTELTQELGAALLGKTPAMPDGRFPLLLKYLDANEILSLQVHPDGDAAARIGGSAALKTEGWYIVESRGGFIYRGVRAGVTEDRFRRAIETDQVAMLVNRCDVFNDEFHWLPAGTVHALGTGVLVAEVQTPSDTTYRVTDWGRGREIHVERSMQCIRFGLTGDNPPGATAQTLLRTEFFTVDKRSTVRQASLPAGRCVALMILKGNGQVVHDGEAEPKVQFNAGDTLLLPAAMQNARVQANPTGPDQAAENCEWLEITLPA